jgi:hypothetical protein
MNLNDNILQIDNINNKKLNFKKLLISKDSLIWKNCSNLIIKINSKINKIILLNCNNIKIKLNNLISGIDIEKSKEIKIIIYKNKNINSLYSYKSEINIELTKDQLDKINFNNENSHINLNIIDSSIF